MSGSPFSQSTKNIYFCILKIKNMAALINFGEHLPITNPTWIFFLVLCIILFAPILLNKLKIPHLIGMILAGILIGEHGFNLLARDSSFELFGQVGLFYIMFLAGLEMNMEDVHAIRWKAIVFGILAFIIPLVLGFFSNIFVLKYGVVSSILLASMYASHTLISYPIVTRYGVARHRCVSIAVGATAITDSLTLLVLAIIGSMYKGEAAGSWSWLELILKFLLAGVFIAYSFPRIGRWFLRKYEDGIVQFIFILAMVFLAAGLMELVGMEGILGAFFAGLVLNRLIPTVSPLRNYLEFVGNALFIPYFLIGVGMIIDMKVFFGHIESMKVAGVMTVMALGTKWIAAWATQKIYGMKKIERQLMFGLSNAQAAATLAAVLVGYSIILPDGSRLLNEDVLNGTIVLILVTCIISSITTDIAARKMALSELPPDSSKSRVDNEKILISFSNQQNVKNLIYLALLVSNPKKNNGLVGLHVMYDNCTEEDRQRGKILLRQAQEIAAKADATLQTQNRLATNLSNGILHASKENDVSEIIAYFSLNEKEVMALTKNNDGKTSKTIEEMPEVELQLPDGSIYPYKGKIITVSGIFDDATGSASVRAAFPNKENLLRSGGSGVVLIPEKDNEALVIPQNAVSEIQDKRYVFVVTDSSTVAQTEIQVLSINDGQQFVVTSGLKPGDRIVTEGVGTTVRNNMKITPITPEQAKAKLQGAIQQAAGSAK